MDENLSYIQDNFIEEDTLLNRANITIEVLNELIEKQLIPDASYSIHSTHVISSSLEDKHTIQETKNYYHSGILDLIKKIELNQEANSYKKVFEAEFTKALQANKDNGFAYDGILNANGELDSVKLKNAFEVEWQYYIKGVYGICTINATAQEIALKEIAVKKLIAFNQNDKLSKSEIKTLLDLNEEFNTIASKFAPYQRKSSSRGKYLDHLLLSNDLDNKILDYD